MIQQVSSALNSTARMPELEWSLYTDGHVLAATLVARDVYTVEAQILLDGQLLYRSRHMSRDIALQELMALRGQWAREGWSEPN